MPKKSRFQGCSNAMSLSDHLVHTCLWRLQLALELDCCAAFAASLLRVETDCYCMGQRRGSGAGVRMWKYSVQCRREPQCLLCSRLPFFEVVTGRKNREKMFDEVRMR